MGGSGTRRATISIDELLTEHRSSFTPKELRLATMLADDPAGWAFSTVAELARQADTSGPTVVRFAVTLGFDGFGALQQQVRHDVTAQLRRPSDRIRQHVATDRAATLDAINATFERLDDAKIDAIAHELADASGQVWIVASESSSPVAHLLATNLKLLRPGVVHLSGSSPSTGVAIADASKCDAVIAVDFPRYERAVLDLAATLGNRGVNVTALTDGPLSPLATLATDWCGVVVPSVGPFDSAAPTVAVAEVIIARVANRLGADATTRLDAVEQQWTHDGVFASTENSAEAAAGSNAGHDTR